MDRIGGVGSVFVCMVAAAAVSAVANVEPASAGPGAVVTTLPSDPGSSCTLAGAATPTSSPDSSYYSIDLVPTRRVPATAYVRGVADVRFSPSPFVVTVTPDGSYDYEVRVSLPGLREPRSGGYVAWVTTTEIDEIRRLGPVEDGRVSGRVAWNKFLVVITLEEDPTTATDRWTGPIAFRGMSRSGAMHTMAGHGPFQDEKCAAYGYQ